MGERFGSVLPCVRACMCVHKPRRKLGSSDDFEVICNRGGDYPAIFLFCWDKSRSGAILGGVHALITFPSVWVVAGHGTCD